MTGGTRDTNIRRRIKERRSEIERLERRFDHLDNVGRDVYEITTELGELQEKNRLDQQKLEKLEWDLRVQARLEEPGIMV